MPTVVMTPGKGGVPKHKSLFLTCPEVHKFLGISKRAVFKLADELNLVLIHKDIVTEVRIRHSLGPGVKRIGGPPRTGGESKEIRQAMFSAAQVLQMASHLDPSGALDTKVKEALYECSGWLPRPPWN